MIKAISTIFKSLKMLNKRTVEIEFLDEIVVETNGVREAYRILDTFTNKERLKKLVIIGKLTEITKDARLLIVEENKQRQEKIIAEAILVNSFAQKLSANFYILFLKNIYPIQFFTDRLKAELWLMEY
ncbi:MAG: hypothetical protein PSX81_02870 [bacterium]|nr:hypothetical protein [bacterium]